MRWMIQMIHLCSVGLLAVAAGCDNGESGATAPPIRTAIQPPASAPPVSEESAGTPEAAGAGASSAMVAGQTQSFDGMKFQVPANWQQLPLSAMQAGIVAAKFGIPDISADVTLTLSTSGGSVEDNIRRWEGQFSGGEPMPRDTISADGKDATVVRLQGEFSPGFGRPAEANWQMIGVIIPMSEHNYFIKLTGPAADVARAEEQFLKFCRSAQRD